MIDLTVSVGRLLDFFRRRRSDYLLTFNTENQASQRVLADIANFCRANETCIVPGDRDRTLVLEGRREVYLRIAQHLNLNSEQLFNLYAILPTPPNGDPDA